MTDYLILFFLKCNYKPFFLSTERLFFLILKVVALKKDAIFYGARDSCFEPYFCEQFFSHLSPIHCSNIRVCLIDGPARILAQFFSFYLSHTKSSVSWVTPSHWERESACCGGTLDDRSTKNRWSYLVSNPSHLGYRQVLYPLRYAPQALWAT